MNGAASIKSVVGGDMDSVVHAGAQLVLAAYAGGTALKVPAVLQFAYDLQLVVLDSVYRYLRGGLKDEDVAAVLDALQAQVCDTTGLCSISNRRLEILVTAGHWGRSWRRLVGKAC